MTTSRPNGRHPADRPTATASPDSTVSPGNADHEKSRSALVRIAATRLNASPFTSVTLDDVAADARLSIHAVREEFNNMHEIGAAVLDHERASMRAVQQRVSQVTSNPIEQLALAFRLVGEKLAADPIVRAGVRIAAESREHFPERRLDPFRTWEAFVGTQLFRARAEGLLREDVDITATAWIVVAAGMGTKDLIAFHKSWSQAPERLETTVRSILELVRLTNINPVDSIYEAI